MYTAKIELTGDPLNPGHAEITMEGCLDINQAEMIREHLLQSIEQFKDISVIIRNVEKMDVAFVQIFHSFLKTAHKRGTVVGFKAELSPELKELLDKSGIETGPLFNNQ